MHEINACARNSQNTRARSSSEFSSALFITRQNKRELEVFLRSLLCMQPKGSKSGVQKRRHCLLDARVPRH